MNEVIGKNLRTQRCARAALAIVVSVAAAGCDRVDSAQRAQDAGALGDSMGMPPKNVSILRTHARPELLENSAAVMSGTQPGVFFTINDSGNDPILFAMDTTGADRGAWRVLGAKNVDWESASLGPCIAAAAVRTDCIYIGDTGDNHARHKSRAVYRVHEPVANGATDAISSEQISYVYADGPHDVEAMYVPRNGDMFFITKRQLRNPVGALRPALVYRVEAAAWGAKGRAIAQLIDSLPIVPGSALLRLVTDASLAADGRHLAVRTYSQVYIFATDPVTGRVVHSVAPSVCNITSLGEPQGEGVTWATADGRLVFTSEGQPEPIRIANCPLPQR